MTASQPTAAFNAATCELRVRAQDLAVLQLYVDWRRALTRDPKKIRPDSELLPQFFKDAAKKQIKISDAFKKRLQDFANATPFDDKKKALVAPGKNFLQLLAESNTDLVKAVFQSQTAKSIQLHRNDDKGVEGWKNYFEYWRSLFGGQAQAGHYVGLVEFPVGALKVQVCLPPQPRPKLPFVLSAAFSSQNLLSLLSLNEYRKKLNLQVQPLLKIAAQSIEQTLWKMVHKKKRPQKRQQRQRRMKSIAVSVVSCCALAGCAFIAFAAPTGISPNPQVNQKESAATPDTPEPYVHPASFAAGQAFDSQYTDIFGATQAPVPDNAYLFPLAMANFTSGVGERCIDLDNNGSREHCSHHGGYDLAAPEGTPIIAPANMEVVRVAYDAGGYGHYTTTRDANGFEWTFAHMCEAPDLEVGAQIQRGVQFGCVGNTGRSTGPHLHMEIKDPEGNLVRLDTLLAFAHNLHQHHRTGDLRYQQRAAELFGDLQDFYVQYSVFADYFIGQYLAAYDRRQAFRNMEPAPRPEIANASTPPVMPAPTLSAA